MSSSDHAFWDAVDRRLEAGSPYRREAYGFVVGALGATVAGLSEERRADPERRHLSGQELLAGVIAFAVGEFGPLAATVFREWGVKRGEDVGAIVFQLVEDGLLSARPEDTLDDFLGVPDLPAALEGAEGPLPPTAPRAAGGATEG
jgi:uncharacterized repeat protein (TIGR04138 family)